MLDIYLFIYWGQGRGGEGRFEFDESTRKTIHKTNREGADPIQEVLKRADGVTDVFIVPSLHTSVQHHEERALTCHVTLQGKPRHVETRERCVLKKKREEFD